MTVDEAIKYVESAWVPGAAPTILAAEVRRLRELLALDAVTLRDMVAVETERDRYLECERRMTDPRPNVTLSDVMKRYGLES